METAATTETMAYACRVAAAIGRKFEVGDLERRFKIDGKTVDNIALAQGAVDYVVHYTGPFAYLLDLQFEHGRRGGGLSFGQMKGALNCLRAEVLRDERATSAMGAVAANTPAATKAPQVGRYTVEFADGTWVTLRLREHWDEAAAARGELTIGWLSGSDNESSYTGFGFVSRAGELRVWRKFAADDLKRQRAAAAVLLGSADPTTYGMAYAEREGACWRCGRTLTVPASLHRGLGPDCAKIVGSV